MDIMTDQFSISFKVKAKHGIIYNYMVSHKLNQRQLAEKIGISAQTMSRIINFKWNPKKKRQTNYQFIETLKKLCEFFKCKADELFPKELIDALVYNDKIADLLEKEQLINTSIDLRFLPDYNDIDVPLLNSPFNEFCEKEMLEKINQALSTLNDREEKILRKRFGLRKDGYNEKTMSLAECARDHGVTKERIRQIEAKALRKLRCTKAANYIKQYSEHV